MLLTIWQAWPDHPRLPQLPPLFFYLPKQFPPFFHTMIIAHRLDNTVHQILPGQVAMMTQFLSRLDPPGAWLSPARVPGARIT